jgi:hypothetical protein
MELKALSCSVVVMAFSGDKKRTGSTLLGKEELPVLYFTTE